MPVPRQRTARLPRALGPERRPGSSSPRSTAVAQRRLVAVGLVLLSLALLTVYLRESDGGPLHGVQKLGSTVLSPLAAAGEQIARPFRDLYGYVDGLIGAKGENERLKAELELLRRERVDAAGASAELTRLRRLLNYVRSPQFPDGFTQVVAPVVQVPATPFQREVVIGAGSGDGVRVDDPVIAAGALAGKILIVGPTSSKVALLTDQSVRVSAVTVPTGRDPDLPVDPDGSAAARGIAQASASEGAGLALERVDKEAEVSVGDIVVTAGWREGELSSLYPKGIPIGTVTSANQTDIDPFWLIQVEPFADLESLSEVIVLTREDAELP